MTKRAKSLLTLLILLLMIFGVPYLWRRNRDNDIKSHSKYAFGRIVRETGSLKNGNHWHYDFYFGNRIYQGHWPTHVDYDVQIGDYFIVNFSSKDPDHNKILYDFKLKEYRPELVNQVWDTVPLSVIKSGRK